MNKPRVILAATLTGLALSAGATVAAQAAPQTAPAAATSTSAATAHTVHVTFSLLVPNTSVTFLVGDQVLGTGTTDSNGDVSFSFSTEGMAPGYYRLVAITGSGTSSSVVFGVR